MNEYKLYLKQSEVYKHCYILFDIFTVLVKIHLLYMYNHLFNKTLHNI